MLEKKENFEIWYKTDNILMLCITYVYYSTVTLHKMHVQLDWSDQKINHSSLSKIGYILTINKWFLLHTIE